MAYINGTSGNDYLYGEVGNDTLDGGAGNDYLNAGPGSDVYLFASGFGQDTIANYDPQSSDAIQFTEGIAANDVRVARNGSDLILSINGTQDVLTVSGYFDYYDGASYRIEEIRFADGTTWNDKFIRTKLFTGTDGNDYIYGDTTDDTLNGGAGNDYLNAGPGSDVYLFASGFGQDTIANYDPQSNDAIQFTEGIAAADVKTSRYGSDLILSIAGTQDVLTVSNYFDPYDAASYRIEEIRFADGTTWDDAAIKARTLAGTEGADYLDGYEGNDSIASLGGNDAVYGGAGNDTLEGGADNDWLAGGAGNDVYLFASGFGQDTISNYGAFSGSADAIQFGAGIAVADVKVARQGHDLVISVNGTPDMLTVTDHFYAGPDSDRVGEIRFADGTVWDSAAIQARILTGTEGNDFLGGYDSDDSIAGLGGDDQLSGDAGNDTLDGGAGNDLLAGGDGNDVYLLSRGSGNDTITNWDDTGAYTDAIQFGPDIAASDVRVVRAGIDLVLSVEGTQDSVTLTGYFSIYNGVPGARVDEIRFADGTVWNSDVVKAKALVSTEGADLLLGYEGDDSIVGLGGDDTLSGEAGHDTLVGGAGNDQLGGGLGNDVYLFTSGFGRDTISNATSVYDGFNTDLDAIQFGAGIAAADVRIARSGWDLVLSVKGTQDAVTVSGYFLPDDTYGNRVDEVRFADGTVWNSSVIKAGVLAGSEGDDLLAGYEENDSISGLGGNDTLVGESGNDTLDGGAGNDYLSGGYGSDVYRFARGFGKDTVDNYDIYPDSVDVIQFGAGIAAADVKVKRSGSDLVLSVAGTQDAVTISSFFPPYYFQADTYRIDEVRFADGTVWNGDTIKAKVLAPTAGDDYLGGYGSNDSIAGLGGNDTLLGDAGNDTLDGGAGNDLLVGGEGGDVYKFARGSGRDTINNFENVIAGGDVLQLGAGIAVADVRLKRSGADAVLSIVGTQDTVTIAGFFDPYNANFYRIDEIRFANGTVWNSDAIKARLLASTDGNDELGGFDSNDFIAGGDGNDILRGDFGNDTLEGGAGKDTLIGGAGNDSLRGGAGNDTYVFARGFGQDTVNNYDTANTRKDAIEFSDIAANEVKATRSGDNLVLSVIGGIDTITVNAYFTSSGTSAYRLDEIRFAGGVVWDIATVKAMTVTASSGADTFYGTGDADTFDGLAGDDNLYGFDGNDSLSGNTGNDNLFGGNGSDTLSGGTGNDWLYGGAGNDSLVGGAGNDHYVFGVGGGVDTVSDASGTDVVVVSGASINQLWFRRVGSDLEMSIIGTDDKISVQGWYNGAANRIEQFQTADGHTLSDAKVQTLVNAMAGFAPPSSGQTTLPTDNRVTLQPVIAANWS
jgi:Ca2+-binding RTX toxin-like protein